MKRTAITLMFLLLLTSVAIGPSSAQSSGAHFQRSSVKAAIQNNGDLTVSWVEAGLGNLNVNYTLTADFTATYFCRSKSGSIPNAANKTTTGGPVTSNGSFEPKNGKVSASLTLSPDKPSSDPPTCGNGQSLDLQSITYTNCVLTDTSNGITTNVTAGTFSITVFPAP
jgi:hypothetical protein